MKWPIFTLIAIAPLILAGCGDDAEPREAVEPEPVEISGAIPNEETWLISRIASALTGQDAVARLTSESDTDVPSYEIELASGELTTIEISTYLWDPELWTHLVSAEVSEEAGSIEIKALAERLLSPHAGVMRDLDEEISAALAASPGSSELHDSAALLLAVFAWREAACDFTDYRGALCDVTAHLAKSASLREGNTPVVGSTGELATILLEILCGRQKFAAARIEKRWGTEPPKTAIEKSWYAVTRTRNETDYRFVDFEKAETLLEQAEYLRAFCYRVGSGPALDAFLSRVEDLEVYPDFTRIFFHLDFHSHSTVGTGHVLNDLQIPFEFTEAARAFRIPVSDDPEADFPYEAIIEELTKECDPLAGSSADQLIPPDRWRACFQRHLLGFSVENLEFMYKSWGNPDAGEAWMEQVGGIFQEFTLFPIAATKWVQSQEAFDEILPECAKLMNTDRAAAVPSGAWTLPTNERQKFRRKTKLRRDSDWFSKAMPTGTVINFLSRCQLESPPRSWRTKIAAFYELAPHIPYLCYEHAENNSPTEEKVVAVYGDKFEIDRLGINWALKRAQGENDIPKVLRYMKMQSRLDPSESLDLGRLYVALQDFDKAAIAYERGWKDGSDDVSAANRLGWLMHYHYDNGDIKAAREVAEFSAEVYSYGGLETMIQFQLLEKDHAGAIRTAEAIGERYGYDEISRLCFILPESIAELESYRKQYIKTLAETFPDGIEKVTLADFDGKEKPDVAIVHLGPSVFLEASPFATEDYVVAIEGVRVRTVAQYSMVNNSAPSPTVSMIVWSEKEGYRELSFQLSRRLFGTDLRAATPR